MKLPTRSSKETLDAFAQKVSAGMDLAYEKLVRRKAALGGYLVLQRNGAIEKVPATELLKEIEVKHAEKKDEQ